MTKKFPDRKFVRSERKIKNAGHINSTDMRHLFTDMLNGMIENNILSEFSSPRQPPRKRKHVTFSEENSRYLSL